MTAPAPTLGRRVLVAKPRGYCAGVDRAVLTVEKALEVYGAPVYVRKQIVHNAHVVRTLEQQGAIFVEETAEVPEGATPGQCWLERWRTTAVSQGVRALNLLRDGVQQAKWYNNTAWDNNNNNNNNNGASTTECT